MPPLFEDDGGLGLIQINNSELRIIENNPLGLFGPSVDYFPIIHSSSLFFHYTSAALETLQREGKLG